jgi:hypothetical protein
VGGANSERSRAEAAAADRDDVLEHARRSLAAAHVRTKQMDVRAPSVGVHAPARTRAAQRQRRAPSACLPPASQNSRLGGSTPACAHARVAHALPRLCPPRLAPLPPCVQARSEALRAELAATEAECEALRNEATVSLAHAAERDRLSTERARLDALGRQQAEVISRQARAPCARTRRCAVCAARVGPGVRIAPPRPPKPSRFCFCEGGLPRCGARPLADAAPCHTHAAARLRTPPRLLRRTRRCARAWRRRACTWTR